MQVCLGEATAAKVMAWVKNKYTGKLRLKVGQLMLILERKGQSCLTWHAACTAVRLRCTECPSALRQGVCLKTVRVRMPSRQWQRT